MSNYTPVRYLLQVDPPTTLLSRALSGPVPDVQCQELRVNAPVRHCVGNRARAGVRAPARVNGATQRPWQTAGAGISCAAAASQARYPETAGLLAGHSRHSAGPDALAISPWAGRGRLASRRPR